MEINIKLTDNDQRVSMTTDFDVNENGDESITPAFIAMLGMKLMFESGEVFEAGMWGAKEIEEGHDPMAQAKQFRAEKAAAMQEVSDSAQAQEAAE